jgi:hypothetical protein
MNQIADRTFFRVAIRNAGMAHFAGSNGEQVGIVCDQHPRLRYGKRELRLIGRS